MTFSNSLVLVLPSCILCLIILRICFSLFKFYGPFGDGASYLFLSDFLRLASIGKFDPRATIGDNPVGEGGIYFSITNFLFTRNFLYKYPYIPNLIIIWALLSLSSLIAFFAFGQIFDFDQINLYSLKLFTVNFLTILLVPAVWISSQTIHFFNYQPRALGLFLGNILFSLILTCTFWTDGNLPELIVYTLYAFVALVSYCFVDVSVFSRQVFVLVIIPSALLASNFLIILALILPICLKFASPDFRERMIVQINYHRQYSTYGIKVLMDWTPTSSRFNSIQRILNFFKQRLSGSSREILFWLPLYFLTSVSFYSYHYVFFKYGFFVFTVPLIVAFLTSLRRFSFIGEGWRYIAFTSIPVLIFGASLSLISVNPYLIITLLVLILYLYLKNSSTSIQNDNPELIHLFDSITYSYSSPISLYCVPYRLGTPIVNSGIATKTTEFQAGHAEIDLYNKYFASFPSILNLNPAWLSPNSFNYLLISKHFLDQWLRLNYDQISKRNLSYQIVSESENYMLASFSIK